MYQAFSFKKLDNVTQVEVLLEKKPGFTVYCKNMSLLWLENKTGKMTFGKKV